jgi:MoaA/NifB/PqqE/SkfB family radical SAM enzyme
MIAFRKCLKIITLKLTLLRNHFELLNFINKYLFRAKIFLGGEGKYHLATFPKILVIDTTYICNLKCKMCHQNSEDYKIPENPHIPVEYIEQILHFAKHSSVIYLLGYGEPFMHPKMYEIITMIKKECPNSRVETTSNGVLFNEKNILKLIDSKLDLVSVSMDGPDLERGHLKSEKTYRNLIKLDEIKRKLKVNHPEIAIGFILGKDNEHELLPIIEFAKKINAAQVTIDALRIVAPQPDWDQYILDNDPYKHRDTILPILEKAKKISREYGIKINLPFISEI